MLYSRLASGVALDVAVKAPLYATGRFGDMPLLDVSSSYNEESRAHAIFIVNRSQSDSLPVDLNWQDRTPQRVKAVYQLSSGTDPTGEQLEHPDRVGRSSASMCRPFRAAAPSFCCRRCRSLCWSASFSHMLAGCLSRRKR
ncbi:MAG: hypothetical protein U0521_02100 [Anaerolineae bacterium]